MISVEGVMVEDKKGQDKKQRKVFRKIPSSVIQQARGIAIFTSMRTGIAPLGGAGGAGVVVAKLPDGSESDLTYEENELRSFSLVCTCFHLTKQFLNWRWSSLSLADHLLMCFSYCSASTCTIASL